MPKRPRFFQEGLSLHIHQRGNNRAEVFHDDVDRVAFVMVLADACRKYGVSIHAWVLMKNHFHLLATPASSDSVPKMMQHTGRRYVPIFNRRWERTGGLWEGRYSAHLIDTDTYWYRCLRYIELNPVRARLVEQPADYRWSSYQPHAYGTEDQLLTPHPLYEALGTTPAERQAIHRALCGLPLAETEVASIRQAIRTGLRGAGVRDETGLAQARLEATSTPANWRADNREEVAGIVSQ
jgi:putative transposase